VSADGSVEIAGVRLSHPDRVLYPEQGITKQALAEYYESVSEALLPHLSHRPLTLVRCPSGRESQCFFQKHATEGIPDTVPRVSVQEDSGPADYMQIDGLSAVVALVQLGVLEFHVWGARADRLDRPDRLVFDLDPDAGIPWTELAAAALLLRERLHELGLESFVRTTGGKGLHVVLPVERRGDWETAKAFTRAVAEELVQEWPHRFVATASKKQRAGKIFIDYLRNAPNATAIACWSTRARPGAPVAVPLGWDELLAAPELPLFDLEAAPGRLRERGDLWSEMSRVRQSVTKPMLRAVGVT
jgi:bifunctional non-homologous end joining protein LigD